MKTSEALKFYENAEIIVMKSHPGISAIKRAIEIENLLTLMHGESESEEIIDLVFEHMFYPAGLNKNE